MSIKEIEALLDKYYEGNSSLQGEKILREFFLRPDIPEHLKIHQPLFQWSSREQHEEMDDLRFSRKMATLLQEEEPFRVIRIKPARRTRLLYISGIAAGILLLVGVFFTFQKDIFNSNSIDNRVAAELAYSETREALNIVSSNLNAGLKQVDRLKLLDKGMKNLQLFNKFYQCQSIIINPDELYMQSKNHK